jgi:hypothetical protein
MKRGLVFFVAFLLFVVVIAFGFSRCEAQCGDIHHTPCTTGNYSCVYDGDMFGEPMYQCTNEFNVECAGIQTWHASTGINRNAFSDDSCICSGYNNTIGCQQLWVCSDCATAARKTHMQLVKPQGPPSDSKTWHPTWTMIKVLYR